MGKHVFYLLLSLASVPETWAATDRFDVRFGPDLATIDITLCFDGAAPDRLYRHEAAEDFASGVRFQNRPLNTRSDGIRLFLPDLPPNACLDWQVDMEKAAEKGDYRLAFRVGDSLLAVTGLWFWTPPRQRTKHVQVTVPEGTQFSSPWPVIEGQPGFYAPHKTPANWPSRSALGKLHAVALKPPGGTVTVSFMGHLDAATRTRLLSWIETTTDAVTGVLGYYPREQTQVIIVPIGPRNEAVPWAHVIRGGGPSVQFYVDENRPLKEFQDDWTATHEFSHLFLPYVSRRDRWLSEGLASYYQNVLRARDGRLSEREAWQKLDEGFQRGLQATRRESLREATEGGWQSTMRVYWSGAAMMLKADTALRKQSRGKQSLDSALGLLNRCCIEPGKTWRARELLLELDRLTGTDIFSDLYNKHVDAVTFPDLAPEYSELGLGKQQGQILLIEDAPLARVRSNIMSAASIDSTATPAEDSAP